MSHKLSDKLSHKLSRRSSLPLLVALTAAGLTLPWLPGGPADRPAAAEVVARQATSLAANGNQAVQVGGDLQSVSTDSFALTPSFSPDTHDYALWCPADTNRVDLTLSGSDLEVDGNSGASVPLSVTLNSNDALVLRTGGGDYWLRCLPKDFPKPQVSRPGNPTPGYYLTDVSNRQGPNKTPYTMVLDTNGTPVWYVRAPEGTLNTTRISATQLAWAPTLGGVGSYPDKKFQLYDLTTGRVTGIGPPQGYLDLHEFIPIKNNAWAWFNTPEFPLDTSKYPESRGATTAHDCQIEEVDTNGKPVWQWRMRDHVSPDEVLIDPYVAQSWDMTGKPTYDPYHCNSIDQDPKTGNYLVSARNMSSLFVISRADGHLIAKIGGSPNTTADTHYTVDDKFSAQHDARWRPNGNISLFDNHVKLGEAARGVEYALDAGARTATKVWEYKNPDGGEAQYTGSTRRMSDGTSTIGWGYGTGHGLSDVDASGNELMRVKFPTDISYRAKKEPLSAFNINVLRANAGQRIASDDPASICRASLQLKINTGPDIGEPVGPVVTDIRNGGCYVNTTLGAYVFSPETGAWTSTVGAIRNKWASTGYENGLLGYPVTDQYCDLPGGGCFQHFQGGSIYWSKATGAHFIRGAIRNAWAAQGWEGGFLGYPTTDESCTIRDGGCFQHFQKGSIYYSPQTGTHQVIGAIRELWKGTGWENGFLGYPTMSESCTIRDGGCFQHFQGGSIYFAPATGTHFLRGAIRDEWARQGWENGRLGYPTGSEVCDRVGCTQNFEHGRLVWRPGQPVQTV